MSTDMHRPERFSALERGSRQSGLIRLSRTRQYLLVACFALPGVMLAQAPIKVSADREISTDAPNTRFNETVAAVNPRNPRNMLVASVAAEDALNVTLVYSTHDGGRTWKRARFPTQTKINFPLTLDPEVAFGDDGTWYFITEINGTGFWSVRTLNGARTWDQPHLHKYAWNYDRSYAAVGRGRYKGRLFVSGVTMIGWGSKYCGQYETGTSDDGGVTFRPTNGQIVLDERGRCVTGQPARTIARDDGAMFTVMTGTQYPEGGGSYYISPSFDGGYSWGPSRFITRFVDGPSGFTSPGKMASNGTTAIDASNGPYHNRMYLAFTYYDGSRYATVVSHSTTDWAHWSAPVVVNDTSTTGDAGIPTIAVNKNGVVAVTWYDQHRSTDGNCYALAAAISTDGGEHFSPNYVYPQRTCPNDPRNEAYAAYTLNNGPVPYVSIMFASTQGPGKFEYGGDTQGLVALDDGSFAAVWVNGKNGPMKLWYTELEPVTDWRGSASMESKVVTDLAIPEPRGSSALLTDDSAESVLRMGLDSASRQADFILRVTSARYDPKTRVMTTVLHIQNNLPQRVRGPLTLVLSSIDTTRVRAADAENKLNSVGARWTFRSRSGAYIKPGEFTATRTVRWRMGKGLSFVVFDVLEGGASK